MAILAAIAGLVVSSLGCNPPPSSSTSSGNETGTEDGTDTGTMKFDVGPECGNEVIEPGEQCDEGEDNGDFPAPCGPECFWNVS